ncbi:MAG: malate dehydrogenase [Candidatus Omnitrophica bacterium]|nr:malate dehydrogenase [Candidatus Omnitrophota bacterium]
MKISVIGAGNVGATLAMRIAESDIADVLLVDIVDGLAKGKAIDMSDAAAIVKHERKILGTTNFDDIAGSDIVVMTAGLARKPGMTRDDLIKKNADIIRSVAEKIKVNCPDALVIVVTNPLDVMVYEMLKTTGFDKSRVIGMAGTLDGARFINILSEKTGVPRSKIKTYVLACHGDGMVPLLSKTTIADKKITDVLSEQEINECVDKTKFRGGEVVQYLKTGSAYYSPSAGVLDILVSIKNNDKRTLAVSAFLTGEYGISGICFGVPAVIGSNGIEKIVELTITEQEKTDLLKSAEKTKEMIDSL